MSDFDKQVDKEAEEEFNKEKKATDDAAAYERLERERRSAIRKAAEKAQGISDSKKDTMVKAHSMLLDQVANVKKAAEDVEEKRAEMEAAQEAPGEAAVAVANASNLIEEKKKAIKDIEERLDSIEADGRDPDAALKQEAASEREALANARADAEDKKAMLRQAEQRALEAKAALQEAEAKLSKEEAERKSLDQRLRLAAAEYDAARDMWNSLAESTRADDLPQNSKVVAEVSGRGSAEDVQIKDELGQPLGQESHPGSIEELQDGLAGAQADLRQSPAGAVAEGSGESSAEDLQIEDELRQALGQESRPGSA